MTKVEALSIAINVLNNAACGGDEDFEEAIHVLSLMENQIIKQNKKAIEARKRRDRNVEMILEALK